MLISVCSKQFGSNLKRTKSQKSDAIEMIFIELCVMVVMNDGAKSWHKPILSRWFVSLITGACYRDALANVPVTRYLFTTQSRYRKTYSMYRRCAYNENLLLQRNGIIDDGGKGPSANLPAELVVPGRQNFLWQSKRCPVAPSLKTGRNAKTSIWSSGYVEEGTEEERAKSYARLERYQCLNKPWETLSWGACAWSHTYDGSDSEG